MAKRAWMIDPIVYEDGSFEADHDELLKLLQDIAGTLRSVGGIFQVQAERVESDIPGVGVTARYVARWDAFTPMAKQQPDVPSEVPEEAPEALPEPVEA